MQTDKITAIHNEQEMLIRSGVIDDVTESAYRVKSDSGHCSAVKAFSCIIEPRLHDLVLFSTDQRNQGHILAILERSDEQSVHLEFPANVTLTTGEGQLNLQARHGINLTTSDDINLASENIACSAKSGLFNVTELTAVGATLVSRIRNIQSFAHSIETVAEHWLQKLRHSFRQIDGVDQLKTKDSLHTVDNLYSMRSKQAAILAKKDIKMDAERIHMG